MLHFCLTFWILFKVLHDYEKSIPLIVCAFDAIGYYCAHPFFLCVFITINKFKMSLIVALYSNLFPLKRFESKWKKWMQKSLDPLFTKPKVGPFLPRHINFYYSALFMTGTYFTWYLLSSSSIESDVNRYEYTRENASSC